ncbi:hypothetical protein ACH5RR_013296 [Cinchona calisaya]|uniref:Uncharacterized protein n=1 Tax=Cinchona calisaya TaxID=153742 RepID=A0ABD2ZZM0_9GENT
MASTSGEGSNNGNTLAGEAPFNLGAVMLAEDIPKKVIRKGNNSISKIALELVSSSYEEGEEQLVLRKRKTPISSSQGKKIIMVLEMDFLMKAPKSLVTEEVQSPVDLIESPKGQSQDEDTEISGFFK